MTVLDLCEKYYKTRNLYEVLNIESTASEKEVKKAYYRVSLQVHPDRVEQNDKEDATEKFKVLGKVHSILTDKDKRAAYDENGSIDDEQDEATERNWMDYWRAMFKPITDEDISTYEKEYKGSETEKKDLKRAYMAGRGDMDRILEMVPFTSCEEEPRLIAIVKDWIELGEVPEYRVFTREPEAKRKRRHNHYKQERKEAERLTKSRQLEKDDELSGEDNADLSLAIRKRQQGRAEHMDNFLDQLAVKYAGLEQTTGRKRKSTSKSTPSENKKPKATPKKRKASK